MSISKTYEPGNVEEKWYKSWLDEKVFAAKVDPDKEAYTVVIPPPNVTGVLHMGHMLNNTIQDILVRKARMDGKSACWVPGTDHASIATETKVVNMLAEKGIKKSDLSRKEFLEHAFEWKDKYGGIILNQLQKIGASCDWDRTAFTMDEDRSEAVIKAFVDLYKKGNIYRGVRMVNWDPKGQTALSDEEVNHKEVQSRLFYIKYKVVGEDEFLTVATTRPETLLGDTAICINPNDERFTHLHGKKAIVPLVDREVPIILDEYVDVEFGTGCLKVTPAHDVNDYELGQKHNLPVIDVLNDDGTVNENGQLFVGEDRFVVRKKIVKELEAIDQFVKTEDISNSVGYSERTDVPIEPKLSMQWFCKMDDLAKPGLDSVLQDRIKIHPTKFKNMYRSWMENIRDWCVSRQLWWGHQIPAYYLPNGQYVVAETVEEALNQAQAIDASYTINDLIQDEDVLDTWFSSWLWPMSVFNGTIDPENEEFKYFYPTADLVTGFDIIFFWVARMIMAGYEFTGEMPFKNVYITGMVRDGKGRKMSKSLGNSPDPLDLIKEYGADGVRVGMLLTAPAGNDLLFDEKLCLQGRNFANKIWNAYRLIKGWEVVDEETPDKNVVALNWLQARIDEVLEEIENNFSKYRISDALMAVYKLVWDDFCSWYLEMVKPEYQQPIDAATVENTIVQFERLLKIIHPFMPFISEELWSEVTERETGEFLTTSSWPDKGSPDRQLLQEMEVMQEVVSGVRNVRNAKGLSKSEKLNLKIRTDYTSLFRKYEGMLSWLGVLEDIEFVQEKVEGATSFIVQNHEFFVPLEGLVDVEAERDTLLKELERMKGFLVSVNKKLANERFVANAPAAVVEGEKKKLSDAEAKIKVIEESLEALSS